MEKVEISILMPVFNVEKYVKYAIESIQAQTLKNWELIILNDGSTDSSGKICDDIAKEDKRIKVIHKNNTGVSNTRNILLDNANSEYIIFVDSDDLIHKDYLMSLLNEEYNNNSDLVVCGFIERKISKNNEVNDSMKLYKTESFMEIDKMKDRILEFGNSGLLNPLWNKLYKKNIIFENNIRFKEEVETGEDFVFNLQYISNIKNISFVDKCLYYYIRRSNDSITYKYIDNMYFKGVEIHEILEEFLNKMNFYNDSNRYILYGNHLMGVFSACLNLFHNDCKLTFYEKKEYIRKIVSREYVKECANNRKNDKGLIGLMSLLIRVKNSTIICGVFKGISLVRRVKA